jgi:hypothetical protein
LIINPIVNRFGVKKRRNTEGVLLNGFFGKNEKGVLPFYVEAPPSVFRPPRTIKLQW